MTFRAAGTSLSGQAISDGILVEVARALAAAWRCWTAAPGSGSSPASSAAT